MKMKLNNLKNELSCWMEIYDKTRQLLKKIYKISKFYKTKLITNKKNLRIKLRNLRITLKK